MFFKRKTIQIDEKQLEWFTREILNLKAQVDAYRTEIESYKSQVASLRGKYNNLASTTKESVYAETGLTPEQREWYESTVEYQEMQKGLNKAHDL